MNFDEKCYPTDEQRLVTFHLFSLLFDRLMILIRKKENVIQSQGIQKQQTHKYDFNDNKCSWCTCSQG